MRDTVGGLLRGLIVIVALLLILGIGVGGVWWLLRGNEPATDSQGISIQLGSLEQIALGIYLQMNQSKVDTPASSDPTPVSFTIEAGETPSTIATRLKRQNLIQDEQLFRYYVRYHGVDASLEAGEYELRGNMTLADIVAKLQHGVARFQMITIPEGWRLEQIAQLSAREGIADEGEFLNLARQGNFGYEFLADRPEGSPSGLEGFLFPETYQVVEGTGTSGFVDLLLQTFDQKLTPAMRQRAREQRITIYEVITLASIVEREAVADEERPIIASVYVNRLNKGMYLQSDPTVQYAKGYNAETGRWWNHMLLEEAQTVQSPYNTFLYPGLPPGPICSPGIASIEAVLYPAETPYLFFFSKGDGTHAFSETYEEHLENMRKYQQ